MQEKYVFHRYNLGWKGLTNKFTKIKIKKNHYNFVILMYVNVCEC